MQLLESGKAEGLFPSDVIERAKRYLAAIPGGTGAYSDSRGAMVLRKDIAKVPAGSSSRTLQLPSSLSHDTSCWASLSAATS